MGSHHHHHLPAAPSCHCHCYHQPTYPPCNPQPTCPQPPNPHILPISIHPSPSPQIYLNTQESYIQEPSPTAISSLLRRIAALESAFLRRSPSHSLRDAAARSIQSHFRAFLVRRSITLRHLKDLASIKSSLGFLKSRVSHKTHFDYDAVYRKAANLLLKLDDIQGGDPMIRNGKISLSRELYKFLDFIEGACVQRRFVKQNLRSRVSNIENKLGNVESGFSKREKLRGLVERIDRLAEELEEEEEVEIEKPKGELIMRKYSVSANPSSGGGGLVKQRDGVGPKVKKNVTFAENGKVYRVLRRPYLEDGLDDEEEDEEELVDDLSREIEEIGVSTKDEVEDGSLSSEGEKELHSLTKLDEDERGESSVFSAPLPAKMERRSG
ncbi:BAG family molecular chaperone regulator 8, chloroplastic-like [Salvia splendens]|uniref:BAG family molecular chaperone regulator 8, chloroplastic-like n=1 Tax=Salvia splendens TaxID=180675 RepID=UPI001C275BDF|nr:BAG family molecular chaperone regulator 8, chloroplastic-like [Salvia splendens]